MITSGALRRLEFLLGFVGNFRRLPLKSPEPFASGIALYLLDAVIQPMSGSPENEQVAFEEALELGAEERAIYLDNAISDRVLRDRVKALLAAYDRGNFLEQAAVPGGPERISPASPANVRAGDPIGRYKLLQQIGEGGCGVVYMAEQENPVRRRVALKIIKLGMDTRSVVARFEAERQALAMMDHPNIAKVLDAGATESGRPYFVMELVRGVKITEYCDEQRLTTGERLDLFMQVCHAVQHAHQKGIIHRDLKPSNILVTINDGEPVPKVIDFGIAKATSGERLTDKTVFTAFEQFIGTPAYMSPEQAVMTSQDIDTRSDIYGLGVLLYELLTGLTPFDAKELLAIGLDEMRRTIREKEPCSPSTRLSALPGNELSTTAHRRRLEVPKLMNELRGDLDWIVMKCLEKDRSRRYETADSLASDVRRHLENEPVLACPPGNLYRFQKFVRRNKGPFAAAAAMIICLIAGLAVSTILLIKMRQQRDQTLKERARADGQVKIARAVEEFLQNDLLGQADAFPQLAAGFEPQPSLTVKEALNRASSKLAQRFANQPLVEAEIRDTLGSTFVRMNDGKSAIPQFERARALYEQTLGPGDVTTIRTSAKLAEAYGGQKGDTLRAETLKLANIKLGPDHPETLKMQIQEARRLRWSGHTEEAIEIHKKIVALQKAKLGPDHPDTIDGMHWLAVAYMGSDRPDDEIPVREEILKLVNARDGPDHPHTVWAMTMLAQAYQNGSRDAEAADVARKALLIAKARGGAAYHNYPHVAFITRLLSSILLKQRKFVEAEAAAREALEIINESGADDHERAVTLFDLATALQQQMDRARDMEAEQRIREAIRLYAKSRGEFSPDVAVSVELLGRILWSLGKSAESESAFRQELAIYRKLEKDNDAALAGLDLGRVLMMQGKHSESELVFRDSLALFRKLGNTNSIALMLDGKFEAAEKLSNQFSSFPRKSGPVLKAGGLETKALIEEKPSDR